MAPETTPGCRSRTTAASGGRRLAVRTLRPRGPHCKMLGTRCAPMVVRRDTVSYFLDLFSPETHAAFAASDRTISGFRILHRRAATRVHAGDVLVCYLTRLSRWVGLLQVEGGPFEDGTPRFTAGHDPFVVRFNVKPIVWLSPEHGIPIRDPSVWTRLGFTQRHQPNSTTWTGGVRKSLARLSDNDGELLERLLRDQSTHPKLHPLAPSETRSLRSHLPPVGRSHRGLGA